MDKPETYRTFKQILLKNHHKSNNDSQSIYVAIFTAMSMNDVIHCFKESRWSISGN